MTLANANLNFSISSAVPMETRTCVGHAFHNDTGPNYDAPSAADAWARTVAFFNKWLRRPR